MPLPPPVYYPAFNVTRLSYMRYTVSDLDRSRAFYTEILGLVVSEQTEDCLYLRGTEEVGHHSLVLHKSADRPVCETVGFRVLTDLELDKAHDFFIGEGLTPTWVERAYQGRTLRVVDATGIPLEFCAVMERMPNRSNAWNEHKGGASLRIDHVQIHSRDVEAGLGLYNRMGFRISDYVTANQGEDLHGVFMYRKDTPYDFVLLRGKGPRMHHAAFITKNPADMLRACDIAGVMGYGEGVERGPGRHAMGHVQFVYLIDPDGHRMELLLDAPHQQNDVEIEPHGFDVFGMHTLGGWGLPAQRSWLEDATHFAGVDPLDPLEPAGSFALEDYLAQKAVTRSKAS